MTTLAAITNFDPAVAASNLSDLSSLWARDPVLFATSTFAHSPSGLGTVAIDKEQARILQAVAEHDRVAIRSGRGVGKTAAAAILVAWWLATRYPALVVTSAGTWGHLEDKLWPEIRLWSRQWLLAEGFEYQQMGIYSLLEPDSLRAVATSSDNPANVEGYHSPHLLLLIDEAKAMPDEIFDALLASLTGVQEEGEQKVVALSTPPLSKQGWFARISSGTEWNVVHISGLDSPRVSRQYVSEILDTYGEQSPEYQSFVLGNIPEFTSETVIPISWFEACQELSPCSTKNNTRRPVLTCDVAREGDDLSVFGVFDRAAFDLVQFDDGCTGWLAHATVTQVVGRCVQALRLHPRAAAICIDDTGLGGGVTDGLREIQFLKTKHADGSLYVPQTCSILGIKFGSKPSRIDRFNHLKDELWWASREVIRQQRIALPTDSRIREWRCPRGTDFKLQSTSALYEYLTDKINVLDKREPGKEKTRTLPTKSPDIAHALILGLRYYMRQAEQAEEMEQAKTQPEALHAKVQEVVRQVIKQASQSGVYSSDPYRRRR